MVMRKWICITLISLLIVSSLSLGCLDGGEDKPKPNKPPVADAGSDQEVLTLTVVRFSALNSTDADGEIESYDWDFGDYKSPGKETSIDPEPVYTYKSPGTFKVTLTVTDNKGVEDATSINVTVQNRKPEVEIDLVESAKVFDVIYFNVTAEDLDGFISRYEWDFDGDGEYDWLAINTGDTQQIYTTHGNFQPILTVYDDLKNAIQVTENITVIEVVKHHPYADAGLNQTVPVGEVLMKGTGFDTDGSITLFEWDFDGDGDYEWSSDQSGIVEHQYSTQGVFQARLRVTDDSGLTAQDSVYISVNNSYFAQNVSAQIYINWNTSYEYLIVLNNTVNLSVLKVVITDLVSEEEEEFQGDELTYHTALSYTLTSTIFPEPNHSIQVQVLYY